MLVSMEHATSWEQVHRWYDDLVGKDGQHYHQTIILPSVLRLLELKKSSKLLDLGCGQGILSRSLPKELAKEVEYVGIDLSPNLIQAAKNYEIGKNKKFIVGDITKPLPLAEKAFTHATLILSLQNVEHPEKVFYELTGHLAPHAKLVIVMNHPYYRIPRQSSWGFDEKTKTQYRKVNGYMSQMKIPIQAHPGRHKDTTTWSFHFPLSSLTAYLKEHGFVIETIEEWCSDKTSTGKAAKWENRARKEFPLFLAILARKESMKDEV